MEMPDAKSAREVRIQRYLTTMIRLRSAAVSTRRDRKGHRADATWGRLDQSSRGGLAEPDVADQSALLIAGGSRRR